MTDNTENLILEHLKRFQTGQDRIENKLDELTRRIANLEAGQASLIQHIGHLASVDHNSSSCPTASTDAWNESNGGSKFRNPGSAALP